MDKDENKQDWLSEEEIQNHDRSIVCSPHKLHGLWLGVMLVLVFGAGAVSAYLLSLNTRLVNEIGAVNMMDQWSIMRSFGQRTISRLDMPGLNQPAFVWKELVLPTVALDYTLKYPAEFQVVAKIEALDGKEKAIEFYDGPMVYNEGGPHPIITIKEVLTTQSLEAFVKAQVPGVEAKALTLDSGLNGMRVVFTDKQADPWWAPDESFFFAFKDADKVQHLIRVDAVKTEQRDYTIDAAQMLQETFRLQ